MTQPGNEFTRLCAQYLRDTYLTRLRAALNALPDEDLFWSPHPRCLSFGNILLHLEGNIRQWILSGLGGAPDHRERQSEFTARSGPSGGELFSALERTVLAAASLLESLAPDRLTVSCCIQGHDTTVHAAILHVVEHMSWHTGQAVWIAKARGGEDHGLAFHDDAKLEKARNRG
jgi:uncharacterized damage-inducible protein DinB